MRRKINEDKVRKHENHHTTQKRGKNNSVKKGGSKRTLPGAGTCVLGAVDLLHGREVFVSPPASHSRGSPVERAQTVLMTPQISRVRERDGRRGRVVER